MFGMTKFYLDKENGWSYKLHNRLQAFFEFPSYIVSKGLKLLALSIEKAFSLPYRVLGSGYSEKMEALFGALIL